MDFTQAANLKNYILRQFNVVLHIHDTCGGLYLSIEEPDEGVKEFILAYCKELSISVTVSEDGRSFFPGVRAEAESSRIWIAFEPDRFRATAYEGKTAIGVCTYSEDGEVWTIEHTYVDPPYRDKGIADQLVEKVVSEAKTRGFRIVPVCSYAEEWFKSHSEYKRLLSR